MKKAILWTLGVLVGLACLAVVGVVGVVVSSPGHYGDPVMVDPKSTLPAADDAQAGYVLEPVGHTLTVISRQDVVIVEHRGAHFGYSDLWIIERPRPDASDALLEFHYDVSEFADAEYIKPPGTPLTAEIEQATYTKANAKAEAWQ